MGIETVRKLVDQVLADRRLQGQEDADSVRRLKAEIALDGRLDEAEVSQLERLVMSPGVNRAAARGQVDPVAKEIQSLFSRAGNLHADAAVERRLEGAIAFFERNFTYHDTVESEEKIQVQAWQWQPAAADARLAELQQSGKLGKISYDGVPDGEEKLAAQYFLHKIAKEGNAFNTESELVIPVRRDQAEPRALYAIRIDEAGNATVKRIGEYRPAVDPPEWQALSAPQAAAMLEQRYGIKVQAGEMRDWSKAELGILARALEKLTALEQQRVRGTVFVRRMYCQDDDSTMGEHGTGSQGRTTVSIYQAAFDSDRLQFAGPGEPTSMRTMLHELGHVLANDDTTRGLRKRHQALVVEQDRLDSQRDRDRLRAITREGRQLEEQLSEAEEKLYKDFIDTFRDAPRLTEYARRNGGWSEFFAEAFSLYKLEPQTLQAEYPELFQYFNAARHLH